ncbi:hypothetical protein L218DRAFT_947505 [Marasmius fiardii PR-910]|nr:hypothetical protein L218DRAFT_947505 [Marasmius fiardii PR-910]
MTSYGAGGGTPSVIQAGELFAGRTVGGGSRSQVFGTRHGIPESGVTGRGFPFYFWPLVWGSVAGAAVGGGLSYLATNEYGSPSNTSRPGGALYTASFQSNCTSSVTQTVLRIVTDNATITDLVADISRNCSVYLTQQSPNAVPFNSSVSAPKPEQVIQYYRASSVALTLDGYNNTAVFASEGTRDVDLPSIIDSKMISCVNETIGVGVPLVDGNFGVGPRFGTVGIVLLVVVIVALVIGLFGLYASCRS